MPRRVYLETFGCQMNELDSELVAGQLRALGYSFTLDSAAADIVLFNTCSVREHAEQKVWSRLGELKARKRDAPEMVVGVLGCMAERDGESLIRRMPVVDVLCGPGELDKLPALLDNALRTRASLAAEPPAVDLYNGRPGPDMTSARAIALQGNASRRSATLAAAQDSLELLDLSRAVSPFDDDGQAKRSAYVRITRGCNKFCTYCVVPFTRGAEVHRPPDHIIDECKRLADAGVVEITLLGQTVNHYRFEHGSAVTINGLTQPQKGRSYAGGHRRDPFAGDRVTTFADLLSQIHEAVPSIARLRFVTSYPRDFGDDVLEVMRDHPRICRYLHVPGQSGSNRILSLMNRGYTVEEYLDFIDRARAHLHQPELGRPLAISGDFIVGFPTETEDDFAASLALLHRAQYKTAFIFKYSPRPGTTAIDKFADDIPDAVKRRRNNEMLAAQNAIGHQSSLALVGQFLPVFVEGLSARERKRRAAACSDQGSVTLTVGGRVPSACGEGQSHSEEAPADTADAPATQLSGRTDTDHIVQFDLPPNHRPDDWIGRIVPVRITSASPVSLLGIAHEVAATTP